MNKFKNLERINKEIFSTLKSKEPYSQVFFDLLFLEFSKQVEALSKSGCSEEEIQAYLFTLNWTIGPEELEKLPQFYQNFLKFGKKDLGQAN